MCYFKKKLCFCFQHDSYRHGFHRSGNSGNNELLQGLSKVRECLFELGKNYIFERSQEKVIFQVNVKLFIFVVIFATKDGDTFLFVVYYLHCPEWLTESQPAFPFPR